ncbi:hypothetical protein Q5P01_004662 [Channa striata]|uniref:Ig-like domain-containing protein n=1 Tax=Channa striata TaxID=64152 RepID=A0AA88T6J9_CHASR|nr:hypothetical protein Q5P01_004662 [Channa striata]
MAEFRRIPTVLFLVLMSHFTVMLVRHGQIEKTQISKSKSDRLNVTEKCSLVIKKVTEEDVGRYSCRQFDKSGRKQGSDSEVHLSVTDCYIIFNNLDSHFIHTSKNNSLLTCEVTDPGGKVQQFPFRRQSSGEQTASTNPRSTESTKKPATDSTANEGDVFCQYKTVRTQKQQQLNQQETKLKTSQNQREPQQEPTMPRQNHKVTSQKVKLLPPSKKISSFDAQTKTTVKTKLQQNVFFFFFSFAEDHYCLCGFNDADFYCCYSRNVEQK